jgi:hypothetical protein
MGGKSGLSGLPGGISSDHELGEYVRLLLRAAVESIEPGEGGLNRIRARLGQRSRRSAGGLACRRTAGSLGGWWTTGQLAGRRAAETKARQRPQCRGWPGS